MLRSRLTAEHSRVDERAGHLVRAITIYAVTVQAITTWAVDVSGSVSQQSTAGTTEPY